MRVLGPSESERTSFSSNGGMLKALKVARVAVEKALTSPTASAVRVSCSRRAGKGEGELERNRCWRGRSNVQAAGRGAR